MDTFGKFSRVADTVGRSENFYFRENRSFKPRCGEGLSTVYPSVQTIRFFVPLGRGEVRKYIEERYRFLNNGVLSIE